MDRAGIGLVTVRAGRRVTTLRVIAAIAIAIGSLGGVTPAAALAAGTTPVVPALPDTTSPFSPGVPESVTPTTTAATTPVIENTTTSSSSTGLSGTSALFIAIGAIVVIGGIAYFIWSDARRNAPATAATSSASAAGRTGSKAPPKTRKLSAAERRRRKRGRAR